MKISKKSFKKILKEELKLLLEASEEQENIINDFAIRYSNTQKQVNKLRNKWNRSPEETEELESLFQIMDSLEKEIKIIEKELGTSLMKQVQARAEDLLPQPKSQEDDFDLAKLREHLLAEPSEKNWIGIHNILLEWKNNSTFEIAVDYVEEHTKNWSDEFKTLSGDYDSVLLYKPTKSYALRLIKALDLPNLFLTDGYATDIANTPEFANLVLLNLSDNSISAKGAEALANSKHLQNLRYLDLFKNNIRDAGAIAIAESENLQNLLELELGSNNITDEGVLALTKSENLKNLEVLRLYGNNEVSEIGAGAISRFF